MLLTRFQMLALLLFCLLLSCGAGGDDDSDTDHPEEDDDDSSGDDDVANDDDDTATPEPECDPSLLPIVFVHGFLEDGDAFSAQEMRFASNGFCTEQIHAYDWNTLIGFETEHERLAIFIDNILEKSGASQVDLMGHSMGGGVCFDYLTDAENASRVAHYVHVAAYAYGEVPNQVPALNLSSEGDTMMGPGEIPGARNVIFDDLDHLQVSTSPESFAEMFDFLRDGQAPATSEILPEESILVSGRTVVFGFNDAVSGMEIQVYEVDPVDGQRIGDSPTATFQSGPFGYWGPFEAEPEAFYEFLCLDPAGVFPPVHYYREPFKRSSRLVYFRVFPAPDTLAGMIFRVLPFRDEYSLFAWLGVNRAVIAGRDQLSINGIEIADMEMADPENTTLAIFFFDANFNGVSDEQAAGGIYAVIPFVRFYDLLIGTVADEPIRYLFNGRPLTVRNWKSRSEGVSIAVFE
jgi:pimeloyl-ACP methyl ester carboxylesterase